MWNGGVRVIIFDEEKRLLMVKQFHEGREFWLLPGGGIEENENSLEAAKREILEETGLEIKVGKLLWHIEEVSKERGMRFVNVFLGEIISGTPVLGADPEFDEAGQVLREVKFFKRGEVLNMEKVYPLQLKNELWELLDQGFIGHDPYRSREHL